MECEYLLLKTLLLFLNVIVCSCFVIFFSPLCITENTKSAFTKEQVGRPQLSNTHFQDCECVEDAQVFISVLFLSYHSMSHWCLFFFSFLVLLLDCHFLTVFLSLFSEFCVLNFFEIDTFFAKDY